MQTFKKNQIIITALVIMIAIAGYLTFTEEDGTPLQEVSSNQSEEQKKR
jgi:stage III sporulation protein AH